MQEYIDAGWDLSDAIVISDNVRAEFGGVWPQGKILSSVNGMPAWADIPPPTKEELIQAAEYERQQLHSHADGVMLDWRTELMLGESVMPTGLNCQRGWLIRTRLGQLM